MATIPSAIGFRSAIGLNEPLAIDSDGLNDLNDWNGLNKLVQTVQNVQIVQEVIGESADIEVDRS
jgi:hypothetical protein